MRDRLVAIALLLLIAAPSAGRASPPIATGGGTVVMLRNVDPNHVPYQTYNLVGTFNVGSKTYKGTVTGGYAHTASVTGGSFGGYNGKHTFQATHCELVGGAPDERLYFLANGRAAPSNKSEIFTCQANIDGTDHAPIVFVFQYTEIFAATSGCCLYGWSGYFVAL